MFSRKDPVRQHENKTSSIANAGPQTPQAELSQFLACAASLQDAGYNGKAFAQLEGAIRVADWMASSDPAHVIVPAELRRRTAEVARAGGCLQEALELSEVAISQLEKIEGIGSASALRARLFRADMLLEMQDVVRASAAYEEISKITRGAADTISSAIEAAMGSTAVIYARGVVDDLAKKEAKRSARLVAQALEGAASTDFIEISRAFQRVAAQFERQGKFLLASSFQSTSFAYQKDAAGRPNTTELVESLQKLAVLQSKAGKHEPAHTARAEVLEWAEKKCGEAAPEVLAIRRSMADAYLECGGWQQAEVLLLKNVEILSADSGRARVVEHLTALRDFFIRTGRTVAAAQVEVECHMARERQPTPPDRSHEYQDGVLQLVRERFCGVGDPDSALLALAVTMDDTLRLVRQRLAVGGGDEAIAAELGDLEEQIFRLPDEVGKQVSEWVEDLRIQAAKTPEQLEVSIAAAERRMTRFELTAGRSKELTRAHRYQELGILCGRAGRVESSAFYFRQARRILLSIDLRESRQYAETLLLNAEVVEPILAKKLRGAGDRILERLEDL